MCTASCTDRTVFLREYVTITFTNGAGRYHKLHPCVHGPTLPSADTSAGLHWASPKRSSCHPYCWSATSALQHTERQHINTSPKVKRTTHIRHESRNLHWTLVTHRLLLCLWGYVHSHDDKVAKELAAQVHVLACHITKIKHRSMFMELSWLPHVAS